MNNFPVSNDKYNPKYAPDNAEIIFFLLSIQFIGFFFYGGFKTIFPFILQSYGYSHSQIAINWSIIFTIALFVGGFFTRIPMGILSDLLSRKQGLIFGTIIAMTSIFLILFTENIIILGILFALLRTGTHIFPLTTRSYVNETNPVKQGKFNGYVLIGTDIASFLGPIILDFFLEISLTHLILFSCGLLLIVTFFLNFTTPKKIKRRKLSVNKIFVQSITELSEIKKILAVFIIIGLINGTYGTVLVLFATHPLNLSTTITTFIVGTIQVTAVFFILISRNLYRKFGLFFLIISGIIFIFCGAVIINLGNVNVVSFIIGSILINGGLQININSLVTSVTLTASKETSATSFGIASGCFFLGASLIPILIGFLYNLNPFFPYIIIIFICLIVIIPVLQIKKEYQDKESFRSALG
ncbi:MAG: MFS transporter [Candidatus Thorarchaeota archaeon]